MKKGMWFLLTALLGMTAAYAVTKMIVRSSKPHVIAFGAKNHDEKNFGSFPMDFPEKEFDDWLS
jgi:hypothetical protein